MERKLRDLKAVGVCLIEGVRLIWGLLKTGFTVVSNNRGQTGNSSFNLYTPYERLDSDNKNLLLSTSLKIASEGPKMLLASLKNIQTPHVTEATLHTGEGIVTAYCKHYLRNHK